jgi:hypothetical protein
MPATCRVSTPRYFHLSPGLHGVTQAMKTLVRDVAGVSALFPTSLVARMAAETL